MPTMLEPLVDRIIPRWGQETPRWHEVTYCATVQYADIIVHDEDAGNDVARMHVQAEFVAPPVTPIACAFLDTLVDFLPVKFPGVSTVAGGAADIVCDLLDENDEGQDGKKGGKKHAQIGFKGGKKLP